MLQGFPDSTSYNQVQFKLASQFVLLKCHATWSASWTYMPVMLIMLGNEFIVFVLILVALSGTQIIPLPRCLILLDWHSLLMISFIIIPYECCGRCRCLNSLVCRLLSFHMHMLFQQSRFSGVEQGADVSGVALHPSLC